MAELKTQKTKASVKEFLSLVESADRRADAEAVCALMQEATGAKPVMWGTSIVGFGEYSYDARGKTATWPAVGFSPRKAALTVYIAGLQTHQDTLKRLGKHTTGKGCLYIKKMSDVDTGALKELVKAGFDQLDGKVLTPR
jgi:hypothetical protein